MIGMAATVFVTAEIGIVHQTNIARLRAMDDNQIAFMQNFAAVDKFHDQTAQN